MKIGILHLSDLHITKSDENLIDLIPKISSACNFDFNEITKLYIAVTGDIANTGTKEEYDIAKSFFNGLKNGIKQNHNHVNSIKFIVIPGNHDCLLDQPYPVRAALLQGLKRDDVEIEIVNQCIPVQNNFWEFYQELNGDLPSQKISFQISDRLTLDSDIIFNCYNSSWMSVRNESDNNKLMPISALLNKAGRVKDITVSVYHHPTSWFNVHTTGNNKKIFEDHLLDTSNIVLCGHEHSNSNKKISSMKSSGEFIYLEGAAFKTQNRKSSFKYIAIDTTDFSGSYSFFELNNDNYDSIEHNSFVLSHSRIDIDVTENFFETINSISIPIKHPNIENLCLDDLYIFPDLEPLTETKDYSNRRYIDALDLLEFQDGKILIEGESQSGRTALLYVYYRKLFKQNYYPLYLQGKDINAHFKIKELVKQCIKQQYRKPFTATNYTNIDIDKRIILIDDIDKSGLNAEGKKKLFEDLSRNFAKIILTTKEANEIHTLAENTRTYKEFKHYRIKPFGYLKRNCLIELWVKLGTDEYSLRVEDVAQTVKSTFDTITGLLGEQLIPSYPIFILSLLQSLDNQYKPFSVAETSYAYCYHSLIILSLLRTGIPNNEVGSVFNFLTEFAYLLYRKSIAGLHKEQFSLFYDKYKQTYPFDFSMEHTINTLITSNLIKDDDEMLSFSYKYLSYYLSAKKIASFMHEEAGIDEIKRLCNNLHVEKNANILIFITHHNTSAKLIEEILFASMLPFENRSPITLEMNDPFFEFLTSFVDNIKDEIVLKNTNPDEYRTKRLKEIDERKHDEGIARSPNHFCESDFNDPNIVDITQTFKIVKILGQIIKNQHGNFEKAKLEVLIESAYLASFRLINFFSSMLIDAKDEIIESIDKKLPNECNKLLIREKVSDFLFFMGYKMCLTVFSNLAMSVGTSSLMSMYDRISDKIGSPAARLISFTIKTYYGKMNIKELEELIKGYETNIVVTHIIKARAVNHVYNNYVPYDKKQKISSICKIKLLN